MSRRIFGKDGPVLLDKNVGRSYGGTGKRYPAHGAREARRAAMRLAASSPPSWPGLSRPSTPSCGGEGKDVDGRDKPGHDEGEGDRARVERAPA